MGCKESRGKTMSMERNQIDGTLLMTTRLQMWAQGFRIRLLISLVGGVAMATIFFAWLPPRPVVLTRLNYMQFNTAEAVKLEMVKHKITWWPPEVLKAVRALPVDQQLAGAVYLLDARKAYWRQYWKHAVAFLAGMIFFWMLASQLRRKEETSRVKDQYVRGARLAPVKELNKEIQTKSKELGDMPPRINLGGVTIPRRNEITPWAILGRPQVGKTNAYLSIYTQIVNQNLGKVVLFDSKGDYTEKQYKGSDLIYAPSVDARSLCWTVFNDVTSLSRVADMAAALIPEGGKDPMWSMGARQILEALLLHCFYSNNRTNKYLWEVACLPAAEMKKIFLATPGAEIAASLLDKPEISTSFSFTVNLKVYLKPLQLLARMDGPFSVRQWLTDGKKDSLFILSTPDHVEAMKPLMNLFLSTLLTAHKSLPDDRDRRIFYLLDELGILPLVPGLADALNFGPSKGLCALLGFQSIQQIEEVYGKNVVAAMLSSAAIHLMFSVGNEVTLESLSRLIGEVEVIESRATLSTGITDNRHGGSSMDQLVKKRLVLPDQIKDLPPLQAYLKILGFPATQLKFKYIPYPQKAEALVPDPTFELGAYLAELAQLRSQAEREERAPAPPTLAPEAAAQTDAMAAEAAASDSFMD